MNKKDPLNTRGTPASLALGGVLSACALAVMAVLGAAATFPNDIAVGACIAALLLAVMALSGLLLLKRIAETLEEILAVGRGEG